jgi:hypothetical protein
MKNLIGRKDEKYKFVTPKPTKDICPYCGFKFEKVPKRKKKCPECENYIFVSGGRLYTKEEKDIRDWLDSYNIEQLGITRDLFNKTRQELSKQFGSVASVSDTAWRLLNIINTPKKSFSEKEKIYLAMAEILRSEGKSADEVLAQAKKMEFLQGEIENEALAKRFRKELLEMKNMGVEMVVKINTCNDEFVCDECMKANEKIFTIDEALENMPIPHNCTNVRCRCWWGFEFPEDY